MTSVQDAITSMQNQTAISNQNRAKMTSNEIRSQDFLNLLTMQLQYQDPMNPMDNTDMLAQEAQFASLEQMEALTSSFSRFSNVFQANSLIGQTVDVMVQGETITGTVDYVDYSDANGASISISGNHYPLSAVTKVYPGDTADKNFFFQVMSYLGVLLEGIADKLGVDFGQNNPEDSEGSKDTPPDENGDISSEAA